MLPKDQQSRIDDIVKALNQHDPQAFAAFYAQDCTVILPEHAQPLKGRNAVRKDFEKTLAHYPDMKYTLRGFTAGGDTIAVEFIARGTHKANMSGPSGADMSRKQNLELPIASFQRINDEGLILEDRRYYDMALVMQQLGRMAA